MAVLKMVAKLNIAVLIQRFKFICGIKRLYVFDLPEDKLKWDKIILNILKTTDYGRCVTGWIMINPIILP